LLNNTADMARGMTAGLIDGPEFEKLVVATALDVMAATIKARPNASEALTEGIVQLMALEFHKAGMGYESATARVLAAFQASWLAMESAAAPAAEGGEPEPPRYRGAPASAALGRVGFNVMTGEGCSAGELCGFISPGRCAVGAQCPNGDTACDCSLSDRAP